MAQTFKKNFLNPTFPSRCLRLKLFSIQTFLLKTFRQRFLKSFKLAE